jgi:YegS/Rv2252/BmrU family lipid kinase
MNIAVVLNPKSANGKTAGAWSRVRRRLPDAVDVFETKYPGHGIDLAAEAIRGGARTVVAVGGDGTVNEVVNGFFDRDKPIADDAVLGIVPHGTGSDLIRTLRLPADEAEAAEIIRRGKSRFIDLAQVRYTTREDKPAFRYCVNLISFGMGGAVAARANRSSKPIGGKTAFLTATLITALHYRGNTVTLVLDGSETIQARIMNVAVGNGQYHGAGMWVCPQASLDDGLLDVTCIRHVSLPDLVRNLPLLYNGKIYSHPKVERRQARRIEARSEETALIEIDGEPLGKLPVQISIVPKAIRVLVP